MKDNPAKVLSTMQNFCTWRHRCSMEVEEKLKQFDLNDKERQQVFLELCNNKYFNDKRFTESFVYAKVSYNKWGKVKIRTALRQKRIPGELIHEALQNIDQDLYTHNMKHLLAKKKMELSRKGADNIRQKSVSYLLSRGYELDEITLLI